MGLPEKSTLIEKFVRLIPLRYELAALAWAIILGTLGYHLVEYIDHGSTSFSVEPARLFNDLLYVLVPFYAFYVVRYLRLRIVTAEAQIVPILSSGESAYHAAFGRINQTWPVLMLALIFSIIALPVTVPVILLSIQGIFGLITLTIFTIAIASFIWTYAISSWGLHRLGESQLKLRSFLEDRMMGARSIGNVALSLTVAYLGGILFIFLLFPSYFLTNPAFEALIVLFLALGVVMFFLPLNSVHKKMQAEKTRQQKELGNRFLTMKSANQMDSNDSPASIERVERAVTQLVQLKDLELTKRELTGTPTWPFDVQLLGRLIVIVLSVTAALISRIILNFLRL